MNLFSLVWFFLYRFPLLSIVSFIYGIYYVYRRLTIAVNSRFTNKNILITGGGAGLGLQLAKDCLAAGADQVILWDRNPTVVDTANQLNAQFPMKASLNYSMHKRVKGMIVDISDYTAVEEAAHEVLRLFNNKLDILVNNAGIVRGKTILESTMDDINATFNVNFLGHVNVTSRFLPSFLQRNEGSIVFISSASAFTGVNKLASYSASKSAIFQWTESLKYELMCHNPHNRIHLLLVCPFYIDTGLFEGVVSRFHSSILPILSVNYVSKMIIESIICRDYWLALPRIVYMVPLLRSLFPSVVLDTLANGLGINQSMEYFQGRRDDEMVKPSTTMPTVTGSSTSVRKGENTGEQSSSRRRMVLPDSGSTGSTGNNTRTVDKETTENWNEPPTNLSNIQFSLASPILTTKREPYQLQQLLEKQRRSSSSLSSSSSTDTHPVAVTGTTFAKPTVQNVGEIQHQMAQ